MEIYKILVIGIVSAVVIVYLRQVNSEIAMPLTICAGLIILILTVSYVEDFLYLIGSLANMSGINNNVFKIILKILAISYLVEFTSTTIEDFGLKSIADKVVFSGKILILTMSAPIIENLISTVIGLI